MTYPITRFNSHNMEAVNGAKEHAIWRHIAPGSCYCAGFACKTRWGAWVATVTNGRGMRREFEESRLSELKRPVRDFMDQ